MNILKKLFLFIVLITVMIESGSFIVSNASEDVNDSKEVVGELCAAEKEESDNDYKLIKEYCDYYGIKYVDSDDFRSEVKSMIEERNFTNKSKREKNRSLKKKRNIPESKVADIIWTDNPMTPWNHVGIYTSTNMITEALTDGVKTRYTGNQEEYSFEIYKVMKADGSGRYSVVNRSAVAAWALSQVGKGYDYDFTDNKKDNASSNQYFNCSELVYKAWKYNGKVSPDLDSNGGPGVYPNNIKNSSRTVKVTEG